MEEDMRLKELYLANAISYCNTGRNSSYIATEALPMTFGMHNERPGAHDRALPMKLLTVKEVAQVLGIAVKTVYAWTAEGKLHAVRLSRKALRFKEREILDLIERKADRPELQTASPARGTSKKKLSSINPSATLGQVDRYVANAKREVLGNA